jgi:hypothetical protein
MDSLLSLYTGSTSSGTEEEEKRLKGIKRKFSVCKNKAKAAVIVCVV